MTAACPAALRADELPDAVAVLLEVLPVLPGVESLVDPAADVPDPGVPVAPALEVEPGVEAAAPPPELDEVPAPLPDAPRPGVPRPVLPVPGRADVLPGVVLPLFASIRPTTSTRCPTYSARSRSPLSRYRVADEPIPAVADDDAEPDVPVAPVEVDPVTPPEIFPDVPDGDALAKTKSLGPSRITHPVSVICWSAFVRGAGAAARSAGRCCEFPGVGACVGAWLDPCAAATVAANTAAAHVLPRIRRVMSPPCVVTCRGRSCNDGAESAGRRS